MSGCISPVYVCARAVAQRRQNQRAVPGWCWSQISGLQTLSPHMKLQTARNYWQESCESISIHVHRRRDTGTQGANEKLHPQTINAEQPPLSRSRALSLSRSLALSLSRSVRLAFSPCSSLAIVLPLCLSLSLPLSSLSISPFSLSSSISLPPSPLSYHIPHPL